MREATLDRAASPLMGWGAGRKLTAKEAVVPTVSDDEG